MSSNYEKYKGDDQMVWIMHIAPELEAAGIDPNIVRQIMDGKQASELSNCASCVGCPKCTRDCCSDCGNEADGTELYCECEGHTC